VILMNNSEHVDGDSILTFRGSLVCDCLAKVQFVMGDLPLSPTTWPPEPSPTLQPIVMHLEGSTYSGLPDISVHVSWCERCPFSSLRVVDPHQSSIWLNASASESPDYKYNPPNYPNELVHCQAINHDHTLRTTLLASGATY
jgi:hypothetical protein